MSSQIRVHDPASGPVDFWIEKPFVTVGSTAAADIRVGGDGAVAASANVRYSDGQFKFFNQSFEDVSLDNQAVVRGKSVTWPAGSRLRFPEGVELELVVEGNPAPAPRMVTHKEPHKPAPAATEATTDGEAAELETDEAPSRPVPPKSKRLTEALQVAVIVVCIGGCIGMIVVGSQKPHAVEEVHDDFAELISDGFAPEQKDPMEAQLKADWTKKLQRAERAFRKGDAASARQQFSLLKSRLASVQWSETAPAEPPAGGSLAAFQQRLLSYAERQLSRIP